MSGAAQQILEKLSQLNGEVDSLSLSLVSKIDRQEEEIKKHGATSAATAKELAEAHEKWDKLSQDIVGVKEELAEFAKKSGRNGLVGAVSSPAAKIKTLGSALVYSGAFKEMVDANLNSSRKVAVKSAQRAAAEKLSIPLQRKMASQGLDGAWMTKDEELTSAELGALVQEFRWDVIIDTILRPMSILDMIPMVSINSNSIEYPEENVVRQLYTELTADTSAASPDIVVANVSGFHVGQTVVIDTAAITSFVVNAIDAATLTITLDQNVGEIITAGNGVHADEFVFTPEANYKPTSRIEFILRTANLLTLATTMPFSKQMLDDFPGLQAYIDNRLELFIKLSLETQVLYGNNTTEEIQGILTHSGIQTRNQSDVAGDTTLDSLRRAITLTMTSFLPADLIVVNPLDWENIELTKGTDDHYVFAQVQTGAAIQRVWRVPVVESTVINATESLVGSFMAGCVMWDRGMIELSVSDQNRDWWERNLLGVRAETRKALSLTRPLAFVLNNFDV